MKKLLALSVAIAGVAVSSLALADYPTECASVSDIKGYDYSQYQYSAQYNIAGFVDPVHYGQIAVKTTSSDKATNDALAHHALASISLSTVPTIVTNQQGQKGCVFLGKYNTANPMDSTFPIVVVPVDSQHAHSAFLK